MARVHLVVPSGAVILGAYSREALADEHRRCATGTEVITIEVFAVRLPSIREDLIVDEWDDQDTPRVHDVPITGYSVSGEIDAKGGA